MVNFNSTIFRTITDEVTGANKSIRLFGKSFAELKNIISSVKTNGLFNTSTISEADVECIKKYNNAIALNIPHQQAMEQATKGASDATAQMIKNANGNTIALNQMTLGAKAASVAMKALSIAGNMIAFLAISKGISLVSEGIDKLIVTEKERQEELQEMASKAEEAKSNIESLTSSMSDHKKTVNDVKHRYAELAQGVKNLGKSNQSQGTLSNKEYDEFLEISDKLVDVMPSLSSGYQDQEHSILTLTGSYSELIDKLDESIAKEKELSEIEIRKNLEDLTVGE